MEEMKLKVPDMSCGHCVGAIQRAMELIDGVTAVEAELDTKLVKIISDRSLDKEEVLTAISSAGYTPELVR